MSAAPPAPSAPPPARETLSVSCLECLNACFHCYGAWHQFDRLYKDGRFDDCARPRAELLLCLRLKLAPPEEHAVSAAVARIHIFGALTSSATTRALSLPSPFVLSSQRVAKELLKADVSPTENVVWQPRSRAPQ